MHSALLCLAALAALGSPPAIGGDGPRLVRLSVLDIGAGAEVVAAVPGVPDRFVVIASVARTLSLVDAADRIAPRVVWTVPVAGGEPTSVACRDAHEACVSVKRDGIEEAGFLAVFGIDTAAPRLLRSHVVGCGPDSVAITPDGRFAVVACEAESTPDLAGRVDVVDLGAPPDKESVRSITLPGIPDAEPEFVAITADGRTAYVTVQEQSAIAEIDMPTATLRSVTKLPPGSEPDGIAVTGDGRILVTADELSQDLTILQRSSEGPIGIASRFEIGDEQRSGAAEKRRADPEGVTLLVAGGCTIAIGALEESGLLIAVDVTRPTSPKLLASVDSGRTRGSRPEVVTTLADRRTIVVANEGEGTVALFRLDLQ